MENLSRMFRGSQKPWYEKKEFVLFKVEVLSAGKQDQKLNEDSWVTTFNTLAVVDGVTSKGKRKFNGQSSGQFAANLIRETLKNSSPTLAGGSLIKLLTGHFRDVFRKMEIIDYLKTHPEERPAADFTGARIIDDRLVITQVGDAAFRINGKEVYFNPLKFDKIVSQERIRAIKRAKRKNPDISNDQLLSIGRQAIASLLKSQRQYANNPQMKFGFGEIDGSSVPKKFIKVFKFELATIDTLEIFSDGYFKVAEKLTIDSWEEAFTEVEKIDPLKIGLYPSTKGSGSGHFTDDRTILIARFK